MSTFFICVNIKKGLAISESKKKKKSLYKTIKCKFQCETYKNIELFPFDKFTIKEGNNGGHNECDHEIDKMRDLLKTKK